MLCYGIILLVYFNLVFAILQLWKISFILTVVANPTFFSDATITPQLYPHLHCKVLSGLIHEDHLGQIRFFKRPYSECDSQMRQKVNI